MLNVSEVKAERSSEPLSETAPVRFSEMLISPYMKERLAAARFTTPTPVQAAAIPQALEGKDVLATAQTGTGKTLAFLIPVIEQLLKDKTPGIAALVLVPTREVAMDRKQEMLQRLLAKETGKCLVFARTKRGTERIAESLNRKGFSAAMIHGDRSGFARNSRAGHRACHQLRLAGSGREFYPSRWANRTQWRTRCSFHALRERAALRIVPTGAFAG